MILHLMTAVNAMGETQDPPRLSQPCRSDVQFIYQEKLS